MIRPTHTHAGKRRPKENFSLSPKVGSPTCYITVATTTQKKAVENFRREESMDGTIVLGIGGSHKPRFTQTVSYQTRAQLGLVRPTFSSFHSTNEIESAVPFD